MENWLIYRDASGLYLNHDPRTLEPEWTAAGHDVDALVGAWWRHSGPVTLRSEDCCDEMREVVPGEARCDPSLNLVPGDLLEIDCFLRRVLYLLVLGRRFTAYWWTWCRPVARVDSCLEDLLNAVQCVVSADFADRPDRPDAVKQVLFDRVALDVRPEPFDTPSDFAVRSRRIGA